MDTAGGRRGRPPGSGKSPSVAKTTPMMEQYERVKGEHADALVLFRMGDFYEAFNEDAVLMAGILGITLTKRANGYASDMDLAGFPYHALDTYLPKLVRAGQRVAICDQLEDPKLAKKIVKRGVTEIVTPGVALDEGMLEQRENNFLASVLFKEGLVGVSFIDVSTGEFYVAQGEMAFVDKLLNNFRPKEVLVPRGQQADAQERLGGHFYFSRIDDWAYALNDAGYRLQQHFGTKGLKGFGIETMYAGVCAAGAALAYLDVTKHAKLQHITGISRLEEDQYVWLDRFTLRNLEVFQSVGEGGRTLVETVDRTLTPMGSRLLRRWLSLPRKDLPVIQSRQSVVQHLLGQEELRAAWGDLLSQVGDLERLSSRASMGRILPREVARLGASLALIVPLKQDCEGATEHGLQHLGEQLNPCASLVQRIGRELAESPTQLGKGGVFGPGVNPELDELRAIHRDAKGYLEDLASREAFSTGIQSLKVGFNNVFGYFFEVRNTYRGMVPPDWERKQTLTQAERYINPELKEFERKILGAEQRILEIEAELYEQLVQSLGEYIPTIQLNAAIVAQLDVLRGFAELARAKGWAKPLVDEGLELEITEGWHPVIAETLPPGEAYVRNSVSLDPERQQIMMITGPNMSGKSALLRQTALIVLLAQTGSYVPAEAARVGIVDKIFTRVGASDNISMGESTFMVEMSESASILNNLSARSLVLLDEIGRGTSTYDGVSIAWAMAEYIHEHREGRAKTLFATHYHELNEMESHFERIRNFNVSVREVDDRILFIRKLEPGGTAHSFGIHVAKLAGMPPRVVQRAGEILKGLEAQRSGEGEMPVGEGGDGLQVSIFQVEDPELRRLRDSLAELDVNRMTPVEALVALERVKREAGLG
ncbi:MAG: DNA mismatch repair protein MutS [Bacteroidia bacterium]|nr:MAG: DNA mismatch repair protein MutS [Bacteroidia bacterium]